ncbi:hypothetical protein [Burkholderia ambifaria]|uniref:hypothetical protein n=1 Tax=Burkholderia ambifaria TaxID=152480 RepID=UPI00158D2FC3|nr:hypothetical protein [Burkholderia ambifaria]
MAAIISDNELGEAQSLGWADLTRKVASPALTLRELGVEQGDRVPAAKFCRDTPTEAGNLPKDDFSEIYRAQGQFF